METAIKSETSEIAANIQVVNISELKPHPRNQFIYGDVEVSDLKIDIEEFGLRERIQVNPEYFVLSGHRRLKALLELGKEELEVEIKAFENEEEELIFIIGANFHRDKTMLQRAQEGLIIEEVVKKGAADRMLRALKSTAEDFVVSDDEQGKSSDIIAQRVGLSNGKAFEKLRPVANRINQYYSTSDNGKAVMLEQLVKKSVDAAHFAIKEDVLEQNSYENVELFHSAILHMKKAELKQKNKEPSFDDLRNEQISNLQKLRVLVAKIIKTSTLLTSKNESQILEEDDIKFLKALHNRRFKAEIN